MNWSPQQQALFELFIGHVTGGFRPGPRNVVVRARAGTGKTTSIVELVKQVLQRWPHLKIVACAFNKEIAEELAKRLPPQAEARTLHSLGFSAQNVFRKTRVDNRRDARLAGQVCGVIAPKDIAKLVEKLAVLGKECLPRCQGPDELERLQLDFDLIADEDAAPLFSNEWLRERAYRAMLAALEYDGMCSYSDMVYVTVRKQLARAQYDLVIVDEAQDMNAGQLILAQRLCKSGGRIIVVGDDRQAIYGFRGAASDALDRLKRELDAAEVPLTITRRCPQAVVALAAVLVPDFVAAPEAPLGLVDELAPSKLVGTAQPGDFVLSRTNAPLVTTCLQLVAAGMPARVRGRNIGQGLVALIKQAKAQTLNEVEAYLTKWADRQLARCAKLSEAGAERLAGEVEDKVQALQALIAVVESVDGLIAKIEAMFSDDPTTQAVMLSTVHKAKGLEAHRVFLLEETFTRKGEEEDNIRYVALTRAKHHLTLVG